MVPASVVVEVGDLAAREEKLLVGEDFGFFFLLLASVVPDIGPAMKFVQRLRGRSVLAVGRRTQSAQVAQNEQGVDAFLRTVEGAQDASRMGEVAVMVQVNGAYRTVGLQFSDDCVRTHNPLCFK